MNVEALIEKLAQPRAYPEPPRQITVIQTHISIVFLADSLVYKIKKRVNLGFCDFSTLEKRRHFCEEEVQLNRRCASDVYLGVVPVTERGFEAEGEPIEWAVKMRRLPQEATLLSLLENGSLTSVLVERLARRLASFHAEAESTPAIHAGGRLSVIAGNARDNFSQGAVAIGHTVAPCVFDRLVVRTEHTLRQLGTLIESRAQRGVPRDTHGDLHLDHIYWFPEMPPPGDLIFIDCIEFNPGFRRTDPIADVAFAAMDLRFRGRADLARVLINTYIKAANDDEGRRLVPFYVAYRSIVRAKVESMMALEKEVPEAARASAMAQARAHWLLALGQLEEAGKQPCLFFVGGLPGSGKSTLARVLAQFHALEVIQSDHVRKELFGHGSEELYAPASTRATYAECWRRAETLLVQGKRVMVDANFREEAQRLQFLDGAERLGVPALFLWCRVRPEVARRRLQARKGDVSDADWAIYKQLARSWQAPGPRVMRHCVEIVCEGTPETTLQLAQRALAAMEET